MNLPSLARLAAIACLPTAFAASRISKFVLVSRRQEDDVLSWIAVGLLQQHSCSALFIRQVVTGAYQEKMGSKAYRDPRRQIT